MTRRETILTLLEHLDDYENTLIQTGTGGEHTPWAMPSMYSHPSVQALYRTLGLLLAHDRTCWANLIGYYRAPFRTTDVRQRVRDSKGRRHTVDRRVRVRVVPVWVDLGLKDHGVEYVVQVFPGEPFLPDELLSEIVAA